VAFVCLPHGLESYRTAKSAGLAPLLPASPFPSMKLKAVESERAGAEAYKGTLV